MIKVRRVSIQNAWLKDAGYTPKEEEKIYDSCLQDVIENTRWYLDNLDSLYEFKVSWQCYSRKDNKITLPRKFIVMDNLN